MGETEEGKGEVRLFRNLGPDGFKDVTSDVGLDKIQLKNPRAVIAGDYDGDGATDLLITQNHGPAVLLRNEGGNKNNWLRLSFKGLADNKSAIGTKVEVFAGANRQKFEIAGSSGFLGQNATDIVVGLGQAKEADVVRMLWPSGVMQDEIQIAGLKDHSFLEMDRRGSSCPTLFAWDGTHYELIGDMLGAGVVGHWVGPDQRDIPRPTEYIKVPRNSIREKDGKLSFRFMEPLEEAVYLDQVKLLGGRPSWRRRCFSQRIFRQQPAVPGVQSCLQSRCPPTRGSMGRAWTQCIAQLAGASFFRRLRGAALPGLYQNSHAGTRSRRSRIAAVRSGCSCTARLSISPPPACTLPTRRGSSPSPRMLRPRTQTGNGFGLSTTWVFPPAALVP